MQAIRTIETPNRTVYIGIQTIMKTEYEKDKERSDELKYMAIQKTVATILLIGGIGVAISFGASAGLLLSCIGLPLLITKQHALVI